MLEGGLANDSIILLASSVGGLSISGGAGFDAISVDRTAVGAFTGILGDGEGDRIETIHSAFAAGVSILGGAGAISSISSAPDSTRHCSSRSRPTRRDNVQGCIIESNTWLTAEGRANVRFLSSRAGRLEIVTGPPTIRSSSIVPRSTCSSCCSVRETMNFA